MGPGQRAALKAIVHLGQAATRLQMDLGYADLAWIAADRGAQATQRLDDPLWVAVADFTCAGALFGAGARQRAADIAARHSPKIVGNRCRIPRGSRGSGTEAKHSNTLPPLTRPNTPACSVSTPRLSIRFGNGTLNSRQRKLLRRRIFEQSLSYWGLRLFLTVRLCDQLVIMTHRNPGTPGTPNPPPSAITHRHQLGCRTEPR